MISGLSANKPAGSGVQVSTASNRQVRPRRSELAAALIGCRSAFIGVGLISGMLNVLALTGSFFMLQVYDRAIPSGSLPTLVGLAILAGGLYVFQGILDAVRGRVLVRIGGALDETLGRRAYDIAMQLPLKTRPTGDGLQVLRDLDQVRTFLSGLGPAALFDLPWMPLYLGICHVFHPLIGVVATCGAAVLISLTLVTEVLAKGPTRAASAAATQRTVLADAGRRNAEVLQAMGLADSMGRHWDVANNEYLQAQRKANDVAGGLGSASKVLRMILQSGMLALGAWLVINQQVSSGIMIASSIMMSRALAPVELAIANWKGFISARQSWARLGNLLDSLPASAVPMALPRPKSKLSVEAISVSPPGERKLVLQDASFVLDAGQGLGIIGPSASGKSSLARAIVGVWRPAHGTVRLDGASLDQWSANALGPHIGYLPQDVELFAGSVAENIGRFEQEPDAQTIIAAARAADVHDLIVQLQDGYETQIGDGGVSLSAGQRQRIALARALYRDPFLVVLDEPNSNLDGEGEAALTKAIRSVRARGGIVIVIAHRPSALAAVDLVLALRGGRIQGFGPKNDILGKVLQTPRSPVQQAALVAEQASQEMSS